jgi:hypothetical protein
MTSLLGTRISIFNAHSDGNDSPIKQAVALKASKTYDKSFGIENFLLFFLSLSDKVVHNCLN